MDRSIRRLGLFLMLLFCALFAQLNYIQVFRADELNQRTGNDRPVELAFSRSRGTISTADGVLLARSVPSDDRFQYQRQYPEGDLYAAVTGYFNYLRGATGLEEAYNDELSGRTAEQQFRSIGDLFVDREPTGNLTLTLRSDVQQAARDALGEQRGSVVVLEPATGDVLALWSNPTFDPNALATHDLDAGEDAYALLEAAEGKPLLPKAYREVFPPGSTFKVITGSAGVQDGSVRPDDPVYPTVTELAFEGGISYTLPNFGGNLCGGALFEILAKSCNAAFGQMGLDLGGEKMVAAAEAFGFNDTPPFDLRAVGSTFPTDFTRDQPKLAQASIGQNDVRATPLHMAMVAAAIANGGTMMEPHVVDTIRDGDGNEILTNDPTVWREAVTPQTADVMRQAMREVVATGSATRLQIDGLDVGAKTGTAQFGSGDPLRSHAWVIAWAGPPGQVPTLAIAVIVEDQSGASEQTGGRLAAPIAKSVLEVANRPMPEPPAAEPDEPSGSGGG